MNSRKPKSPHWRKLEVLKSLNLDGVAADLNRKYLARYQAELSCPTAAERKKKPKLARLYDEGKLVKLPSDLRASGRRMRRVLIAVQQSLRDYPSAVLKAADLAALSGLSKPTTHRGMQELVDACLVDAPPRERARATGGNGACRISIVWSNVRELAIAQGMQPSLFADADLDSEPGEKGFMEARVAARSGRPENSSGRERPSSGQGLAADSAAASSFAAPTHFARQNEQAPTHCDHARDHCEQAPTHCDHALDIPLSSPSPRVRAPASSRIPFINSSSFEAKRPADVAGEKKKFFDQETAAALRAVRDRLAAYGVATARGTAEAARLEGWTVAQINELLDECDRQIVLDAKRWEPGQVAVHLRVAAAGCSMRDLKKPVAWVRACRERDLALERRRAAAKAAAAQERSQAVQTAESSLERDYGPLFDSLSAEERHELAGAVLVSEFQWKLFHRNPRAIRRVLLAELARRGGLPATHEPPASEETA